MEISVLDTVYAFTVDTTEHNSPAVTVRIGEKFSLDRAKQTLKNLDGVNQVIASRIRIFILRLIIS